MLYFSAHIRKHKDRIQAIGYQLVDKLAYANVTKQS